MDKLTARNIIISLLKKHSNNCYIRTGSELQMICDYEQDHYLLLLVGWYEWTRQYGSIIHIDIKHNKIWIQSDQTQPGIAQELVELGINKDDIVLAIKSPYTRQYTDYAKPTLEEIETQFSPKNKRH